MATLEELKRKFIVDDYERLFMLEPKPTYTAEEVAGLVRSIAGFITVEEFGNIRVERHINDAMAVELHRIADGIFDRR